MWIELFKFSLECQAKCDILIRLKILNIKIEFPMITVNSSHKITRRICIQSTKIKVIRKERRKNRRIIIIKKFKVKLNFLLTEIRRIKRCKIT
jgi:hypothetical protein